MQTVRSYLLDQLGCFSHLRPHSKNLIVSRHQTNPKVFVVYTQVYCIMHCDWICRACTRTQQSRGPAHSSSPVQYSTPVFHSTAPLQRIHIPVVESFDAILPSYNKNILHQRQRNAGSYIWRSCQDSKGYKVGH